MSYLVINREASSSSKWEQVHGPILYKDRAGEFFEHTPLNGMLPDPFSKNSRDPEDKEAERVVRSRGNWAHQDKAR